MNTEKISEYYKLRNDIDAEISGFEKMHAAQLKCKKGCDSCCESLTIFPLEFMAIKKELGDSVELPKKLLFNKFTKSCRFLVNGECQIYNSRPIICRTQGMPLLYENRNGSGFELSVCHLNFVGVNVSTFNMENALYMAPFNSRLYLLNSEFVNSEKNVNKPHKRIKLNTL